MLKRIILIGTGLVSLGIGILGIFLPGLPTTVFLLYSAWAFVRSSTRLYNWLLSHKILGRYIKNFLTHKSMKPSTKIYAMSMMWLMITISTSLMLYRKFSYITLIVMGGLGIIGSISILLVPTRRIFVEHEESATISKNDSHSISKS